MGGHCQNGKYALFVSLFVSSYGHLESILIIREPIKKTFENSTEQSHDIALFLFVCFFLLLKHGGKISYGEWGG